MENEKHKKKKVQNYKISIKPQNLKQSSFQVLTTENAYFPYQPYPQQVSLISQLNKSIMNNKNCLVQSPTGTGKTLCMLVASLSALCTLTLSQNVKVPKIFYLTRTHSQVTQVINELKRLPWYSLKLNIIASREHLCINRNLRDLKGKYLDRACQQTCKQKLCRYKQQMPQNLFPLKQWLTIQQLCQKGNKKNFCPFYSSKISTQKCELTILPFNYLLDWNLFQHNNFNLKNSVIIFDEAHNVDSLAEQGSSLQIDTQMLTQSLIQLKNLQQSSKCRYLHKKFQNQYENSDYQSIGEVKSLIIRMNTVLKESNEQRNYNQMQQMLRQIKKLTNFVNNSHQFKGLDLNNYQERLITLDRVKRLFSQKKIQCDQFQTFCSTIKKIMNMLDKDLNNMEDYFMSVGPKSAKNYSIKFNCLNASFTFKRILLQRPRSIILCSGTLGSFQIWQNQLGVPFQTKIRLPSFIKSNQLYTKIVGRSLSQQVRYQFSYQTKSKQEQFQTFGSDLKQIQKVVPNGMVVAFSTYQFMQKCMKYCLGLKKQVFYESKHENIQKIYSKYSLAAKQERGALLFIVMKGKFSEGINFNDQLCRCLIVVGIPFLPTNDNKVLRKKRYLSNKFGKQAAQQWYYSQTFKSVNQVIGRVIRSKKDYGCVLLFDQRYQRKDIKKQLPTWFVANLQNQNQSDIIKNIKSFFQKKHQIDQQNKDRFLQSSFQIALSKTMIANEQNKIPLQSLLNQVTPVKIKKPKLKQIEKVKQRKRQKQQKQKQEQKGKRKHLKLKIQQQQEEDSFSDTKQAYFTKELSIKNHIKDKQQASNSQKTKKYQYPWLSIDHYVSQQIKSFVQNSTNLQNTKAFNDLQPNQEQISQARQQKALLTVQFNKSYRRNIKYI